RSSGTSASVPSGNPTTTVCLRTRIDFTLPAMQPPPPHVAWHGVLTYQELRSRQPRAELLVRRELIEETALQPSAVAEQPVVGERHVLGLRHPHRDRLEAPEVRRAAELAPARPDAVHELGRVARADLAHLDPRVELAREVADQLAKVDALVGVEIDGHAARRGLHLDVHDLELEPAPARHLLAGADRARLALAALAVLAHLRLA